MKPGLCSSAFWARWLDDKFGAESGITVLLETWWDCVASCSWDRIYRASLWVDEFTSNT